MTKYSLLSDFDEVRALLLDLVGLGIISNIKSEEICESEEASEIPKLDSGMYYPYSVVSSVVGVSGDMTKDQISGGKWLAKYGLTKDPNALSFCNAIASDVVALMESLNLVGWKFNILGYRFSDDEKWKGEPSAFPERFKYIDIKFEIGLNSHLEKFTGKLSCESESINTGEFDDFDSPYGPQEVQWTFSIMRFLSGYLAYMLDEIKPDLGLYYISGVDELNQMGYCVFPKNAIEKLNFDEDYFLYSLVVPVSAYYIIN